MDTRIVQKHKLLNRWAHWVNFPVLALMVWSGLLIYWANDIYTLFGHKVVPTWVFDTFNLKKQLATGLAWHFALMWLFSFNGLAYVVYMGWAGGWREVFPNKNSFKEALQVMLYDLKLSKVHPPQKKYNGAQKIAYSSIIVMGAGSLASGLAIYKPAQLGWLTALMGGYETSRLIHFLLTIGYCAFFFVHIVQVVRAGWNNFRGMVTGHELIKGEGA